MGVRTSATTHSNCVWKSTTTGRMHVEKPRKVGPHGTHNHSSSRITRRRRVDFQSLFFVANSRAVDASTKPPINRFV